MAITDWTPTQDYFITPAGAGGHDGSDFANAFSWAEFVAAGKSSNYRWNFAGDFSSSDIAAAITTGGGAAITPVVFRGWKADLSAPADSLDDMPSFDANSTSGNFWTSSGSYAVFMYMEFMNAAGVTISFGTNDNCMLLFCSIHDGGGNGVTGDDQCKVVGCKLYNNSAVGSFIDFHGDYYFNEVYGNTADGINGDDHTVFGFNYVRDNGSEGINCAVGLAPAFLFNVCDANQTGLFGAATQPQVFIGNQITNNTTGINGVAAVNLFMNNNIWNNSADTAVVFLEQGEQTANPSYTAIGSNDFTVETAGMLGLDFARLRTLNIGAFQDAGGGGNGGGALAARAGIFGPAGSANYYWPNIGG